MQSAYSRTPADWAQSTQYKPNLPTMFSKPSSLLRTLNGIYWSLSYQTWYLLILSYIPCFCIVFCVGINMMVSQSNVSSKLIWSCKDIWQRLLWDWCSFWCLTPKFNLWIFLLLDQGYGVQSDPLFNYIWEETDLCFY